MPVNQGGSMEGAEMIELFKNPKNTLLNAKTSLLLTSKMIA
jgi:hypothetical protein